MNIVIQRSRLILAYLLLIHLCALIAVNLVGLPPPQGGLLSLLVLLSLAYYCYHFGWLGRSQAIVSLRLNADGNWFWSDAADNQWGPMRLKSSVLLGPLMAIYFRDSRQLRTRSVLLACDGVDADSWRRLRVRLRDPESWD